MLYGYVRVSTDKQTVENQKLTITNYVQIKNRNNQHIERVSETESGTKSYKDRQLGNLVEQLQKDDILLISELSRLGRSLFEVMEILGHLMQKEVQVISIKEGFELGENISSKVLAFAFSLSQLVRACKRLGWCTSLTCTPARLSLS